VDVPIKYLNFFLEDDNELEHIKTEVMASSLKVVIGTKKFRVICSPDNKNDA
jgi:hypothetical protein